MNSTKTLATLTVILLASGCSSSSPAPAADNSSDAGTADEASVDVDASPDADDDAPANGCVYPAGPYGVAVGKVLNPSLQWQGYLPKSTTPTTLKVTDLYDCDGTKGLNAIVVDSAGQWCVACQGIAKEIPSWLSPKGDNWLGLGVQILNLVIQNNDYEPATVTTAQQWRDLFGLTSIYVVADPSDTFPTDALPYELLVDPRTMKVVHDLSSDSAQTADGADPAVATLAMKNATTK
ncbi:MAG TPA: hypothetical protein VHS09_16575 [Polyangiaceae bacterium]|nr:hypothetical protein [Polyangiaceae bacterium]